MPGPKLAIDIHADASDLLQLQINFVANGDNTIIAGVSGQIIRVWKLWFISSIASNIQFKNGTVGISGPAAFAASEGMVLDFDTKPWATCSSGSDFVMNQDGGAQVSGTVYYTQA
jgi:hypothetical protein